MESERRDVIVGGAGVSGLSTAWHLRDRDVLVLEEADRVGGRIRSERRGGTWLDFGAYVYGGEGTATDRLLPGLRLVGDYLGTRYVETCAENAENAEMAALRIREQLPPRDARA